MKPGICFTIGITGLIAFTFTFTFLILTSSCSEHRTKKQIPSPADKNIIYAGRFDLHITDSCTILTITDPWQGAGNIVHEYYLIRDSYQNEIKANPSKIIKVPIKRIICMSTTHIAMIQALGKQNSIVAISGAPFVYDKEIHNKIRQGLISDIGYDSGLNTELIIKSSPDLVMIYGIGSESAGYTAKISELGMKVMYNADYLETDPLGKAEWIKVFGALYCCEEKADSIFRELKESYFSIKERIGESASRPVIMLGMPFRDTWYVSPGNSYISKLINDAGGIYLWEKTESSISMPYSLESVYSGALKADIWLNSGSVTSKLEIISLDNRLGSLKPFINNRIYNNNKRLNGSGGNDYWESGTLKPHIILKDIASIIHPEIFPDHEPVYYRKIE